MEGVNVKEEPADFTKEEENQKVVEPSNSRGEPEFITIKTEIEVPNTEIRIKIEPHVEEPSPVEEPENTWLVPIEDTRNVLVEPAAQIKEEPDDSDNSEGEDDILTARPTTSQKRSGSNNTGETDFSCHICLKSFANASNVQRHMLIHSKKKYNCTECTKQFTSQELLDKHMQKHTYSPPEKPYACEHCDKQFRTSSNLMQHKRVHMDVKPYFCSQCHRSFAFKANLTKHQGKSRCKRPIDEPIKCHVCNKIFQKEFLLKSHLRRHDTERPFDCEQCNMKFKYKSTLMRHLQLHDGIRPFPCPVCDKSFTHLGLLKPHMRVHTGEKPYKCPICPKSFGHKHNMQRHAMRHNKVKHLECDICHKKFPKESRLIYHMKTHINEKHFSCHICPKKFSHKQNVLRHYTRKHPNAKYEGKETDASVALKVWDTFKSKYSDDPEEILG